MAIQVALDDNDKHIITVTYHQPWNWEEFDAAVAQVSKLLDEADGLVDLIFDVREGGFPPQGAVSHFRNALRADRPNTRQLIFVGGRNIVIGLFELIFRVYGRIYRVPRMRFVTSKEEAYAVIAHQRSGSGSKQPQ